MPGRFLIADLLFAASVAFQVNHIGLDAFTSDEALVQVASADVARGRILYRDSYVPVTPLVYLMQGAVFKLTGTSFQVSRWLALTTNAAGVSLAFLVANAFIGRQAAVLSSLLIALLPIWTWPHGQYFSYSPLALTFCMLALHLSGALERSGGRRSYAVGLGVSLGFALWVKPNLGLMAGFGIFLFWLSAWARCVAGLPVERARSFPCIVREGLWTTAGVLAVSIPIVAHLVITDTWWLMVESLRRLGDIYAGVPLDLFPSLFPLASQTDALRVNPTLTIPGMLSAALIFDEGFQYLLQYTTWLDQFVRLVYCTPLLLQFATAVYLLRRLWRGLWTPSDEVALRVLLVTASLFLTLLPHAPIQYLTPLDATVVILACFLASRGWHSRSRWRRALVRGLSAAGIGGFVLVSGAIWILYVRIPREPLFSPVGTIWLPSNMAQPLTETLSFTKKMVKPDETILAIPYFPIFYFLSGIDHATRFTDLRPGSPGPDAEDEMISDLERLKLARVVFFVGVQFPGNDSFEDAYPRFYHYLVTHYVVEETVFSFLGPYAEIYRRVEISR